MTRICIDGWNLALAKGSGIATYGRNLLSNLEAMNCSTQVLYGPAAARSRTDFMNEVALVDAKAPLRRKAGFQRSISTVLSRFGHDAYPVRTTMEIVGSPEDTAHALADQVWASTDLFNLANRAFRLYRTFTPVNFKAESEFPMPDVMHWTCPLPVHVRGVANIYTFHDLIPLRLPHTTLDDKQTFHDQCHQIVRKADHIITVSEATRQDLIRMFDVAPDRVTNTYQAVTPDIADATRSDETVAKEIADIFDLEWKGYFLFYGAVEPKKNLGRLLEAYLKGDLKTPLVIVAGRAWLADYEMTLLKEVAAREGGDRSTGIRHLEYLPAHLLKSLVRGAKATLFPSLYEGFGLPVLESMMVGTAVLTSPTGSLPEVAGDAALMVDPLSVDSIRDGLITLEADELFRKDLELRSRIQAARFAPEAYHQRLQVAYKAVGAI